MDSQAALAEPPILTDMDACAVMEAHFGAPLSSAGRGTDGVYSIELMGRLPTADQARRAALSAASPVSYEAALWALASRRADLLQVPLDEETGLFMRLRRHRTDRHGIFLPRDAPLTSADCSRLEELNQVVPQLRTALRTRLVWSSTGPAGFRVEVYAQFMLHRILALVDGSAAAWNGRNSVAAAILARAVLESVAVWVRVSKEAERHLAEHRYDDYDKLFARIFFGKKNETGTTSAKSQHPALSPIQVLTAVETLERDYPGVKGVYDELCEIAHPNGESFFAISDWHDVDSVSLDPAASNGDLFGKILSAIRLDITSEYLSRWEKDLAPRIGRLWREAHKVSPVETG
jgi:hypothetical protein